jgi:hypothetical protein
MGNRVQNQTLKAISKAFSSNSKLNTLSSSNAKDSLVKDIQTTIKSGYEPEGRKEESKEATGSGSAGQYSAPLFSGEMEEKWSEKYKKSINCSNPKGFSQRAHCQGRKKKLKESLNEAVRSEMAQLKDLARKFAKEKSQGETEKENIEKMLTILQRQFRKGMKVEMEHKMGVNKAKQIALDHLKENPLYYDDLEKVEKPKKTETKEATGASSAGQYSGPAFGAKSMSPKHWRGRAKTQIPGGAFVQVKKKCKTFPYCNQGDINAVELSRNPVVKKKKKKLAEQYGVSEELIMQIIINELYKNLKK